MSLPDQFLCRAKFLLGQIRSSQSSACKVQEDISMHASTLLSVTKRGAACRVQISSQPLLVQLNQSYKGSLLPHRIQGTAVRSATSCLHSRASHMQRFSWQIWLLGLQRQRALLACVPALTAGRLACTSASITTAGGGCCQKAARQAGVAVTPAAADKSCTARGCLVISVLPDCQLSSACTLAYSCS